jgi:hypothetical protein
MRSKMAAVSKLLLVIVLLVFNVSLSQSKYINENETFDKLKIKKDDNYIYLGYKSWYKNECLFDQESICKQITSGGARVFIKRSQDYTNEKLLISNKAGYQRPKFDTLSYSISNNNSKDSFLIKKLYFENEYKKNNPFVIDTVNLKIVDTLYFKKEKLIKRVLKDHDRRGLKILVFTSSYSNDNDTFHFWVESIGIIKVVYLDCWSYSFELNFEDYLPKRKNKLFKKLLMTIKEKYKDPEWFGAPCNIFPRSRPNSFIRL